MKKVLVIAGQTASGKTNLSLDWAQHFNGEIINADSQQVYRGLNIGTAKIDPSDMRGIPHHLLNILDKEENFSVKEFQSLARTAIDTISAHQHLPILVGGTGFYLKAALYDYVFMEEEHTTDHESDEDNETLYQRLNKIDPKACESIHPNNRKRILRALSIAESGVNKSTQIDQQDHTCLYDVFWVVLTMPKDLLDQRIQMRVDQMRAAGLKQEVLDAFNKEEQWTLQSFQAIGYKEWLSYLKGEALEQEVYEKIVIRTRQFAKRQMTWFRHQFPSRFVNILDEKDTQACLNEIQSWLKETS